MAKRRNRSSALESLILIFMFIVETVLKILVRIIIFTYDLISFFASSYKQKSGNSFFKTYFNKGNYGEFVLYRKVIRIFGKESVLTNVYLENTNTENTEIDVLAVSNKGVYVLEMKNYSGYIYGSEKDQNWTQVLNKWTKNKFYNPLRQNFAHTKAVESYLEIPTDKIIPIIIFSNRSKLSKIEISGIHNVFQYRDSIKYIKRYEKKQEDVFTLEEKKTYLMKLIERCNMPLEVKQKHIDEVKELKLNSNQ